MTVVPLFLSSAVDAIRGRRERERKRNKGLKKEREGEEKADRNSGNTSGAASLLRTFANHAYEDARFDISSYPPISFSTRRVSVSLDKTFEQKSILKSTPHYLGQINNNCTKYRMHRK